MFLVTDAAGIDTVIRCTHCGTQYAYSYAAGHRAIDRYLPADATIADFAADYDRFLASCISETARTHTCQQFPK